MSLLDRTPTTATEVPATSPRRRRLGWLVVGLAFTTTVVLTLVVGQDAARTGYLDPDNPGPDGGRAVARVLAEQGVDVEVVRSADALAEAAPGAGDTVVVTDPSALGRSTAERLRSDAEGSTLLVVGAGVVALEALDLDVRTGYPGELGEASPSRCDDPLVGDLTIAVDQAVGYVGRDGCFGDPAVLVETDGLVLLGAGDVLSNDQVVRADNAALALRLLGQQPRLVWYVPSFEDQVADDSVSLGSLLPRWLQPALVLLGMCLAAVVVWRARRLGPLATEPLPVVVRAVETTRSLGRMYRRASAQRHAANRLRTAARRRCATHLRLGAAATVADVVRASAEATGRPLAEVDDLIGDRSPSPRTDQELVTLADALSTLTREVRQS